MTDQNNSSIANSPDPAAERRQQLAALIPEAFSEGQLDVGGVMITDSKYGRMHVLPVTRSYLSQVRGISLPVKLAWIVCSR